MVIADQCVSDLLMTPSDTEAQEKLGIRCNFTPVLKHRRKDESWFLKHIASLLRDWGDAPLTEEFVFSLELCQLKTEQFEQMRGRAVSALRNTSNKGSLPIDTNKPPYEAPFFECRACFRVRKGRTKMHEHRIYCHANREAFIKIKALGLALKSECNSGSFIPSDDLPKALLDTEAQEKLGIRFDYVGTIRRYTDSDLLLDEHMRSQLKAWGKMPLTEEFVSNLGYPSNLELLERRRNEKWPVGPYRDSLDGLLDLNTPKRRSLLDSDASPPRKRNCTSSPVSLEVNSEDGNEDEDEANDEEWISKIWGLPLSEIFC